MQAPIYPVAKYAYFDRIQIWLLRPLNRRRLDWLEIRCDVDVLNQPANHSGWPFKQRIQLRAPIPSEILSWLSTLKSSEVLLNALEIALDWTFSDESQLDHSREFFRKHVIQRWQTKQAPIVNRTVRYSNRRGQPNVLVDYSDKPCRVTGELYCHHIEWRLNGARPIKRAGISLKDLKTFDHNSFWAARLQLVAIGRRVLGRISCNRRDGTPRRRHLTYEFAGMTHDLFANSGSVLLGALGGHPTMQEVMNAYGKVLNLTRHFERFDTDHLLPYARDTS